MKKLFLLLLLVSAVAAAQTAKDIHGKWRFKEIKPTTEIAPEKVAVLNQMMKDYVAAFNEANMRYVAYLMGRNEGGKWTVKDKALVFSPGEGTGYTWPIHSFSANELSLEVQKAIITFERVTGTAQKQQ